MKRLVLLLIAAVSVLLSGLPAAARTPADLSALARFFPASTPMFIGFRTDDDFIATLDNLFERVAARLPDTGMEQSLRESLDGLDPDGSFQRNIRSWLGDIGAVGIWFESQLAASAGISSSNPPTVVAFSVKDAEAALDFVVKLLDQNRTPFFQTAGDDYTLLVIGTSTMPRSLNDSTFVVVRDEALFISADSDIDVFAPDILPSPSLAETSRFSTTLGWLPAESYNAIVYNDVFGAMLSMMPADDPTAELLVRILERLGLTSETVGPQIFGFTILDGTTLTIDLVNYADPTNPLVAGAILPPLDPAFAAHIPADVPLAVHFIDLKTQVEVLTVSVNNLFDVLTTLLDLDIDEIQEVQRQLSKELARANNLFTSLTKLDFVEDVLSWLDGNGVVFLGFNPELDATSSVSLMRTFPFELGIGFEVTDAAKAQVTFDGLTLGLQQLVRLAQTSTSPSPSDPQLTVTTDELMGTPVTVMTITGRDTTWPIELLMGTNDRVFAIGTRNAVRTMFAAEGDLNANAAFRAAQAYMLPDASSLAWLYPAGLLPLADMAQALSSGPTAEADTNAVRSLLSLIASGTITTSSDLTRNLSLARMTLTLNVE